MKATLIALILSVTLAGASPASKEMPQRRQVGSLEIGIWSE